MSYSLIGNFFINNELVQAANLDRLKVLNERRYSSSLKNVDPINYVADCFGELPDNGYMYNVTSFENALEIEKKNYISLKREFNKLKNLKSTLGFYELSEEAEDKYYCDLSEKEEELEEEKYKVDAIKYMIDIFYFLSDTFNPDVDEVIYHSVDDVLVYIYSD